MIKTYNKIHFFGRDESCENWVNIKLESYAEIHQQYGEVKLKRLESIRLFFHQNMPEYECASFHIDFGRDDCHYSGCKSREELYKYMQSDSISYKFKPIEKDEYLKIRNRVMTIYLQHSWTDYDKLNYE